MTELLGSDIETLTKELSSWCAVNYPTATEATWDKAVIIDYDEGVLSTNFMLNTESPVPLAVNYYFLTVPLLSTVKKTCLAERSD